MNKKKVKAITHSFLLDHISEIAAQRASASHWLLSRNPFSLLDWPDKRLYDLVASPNQGKRPLTRRTTSSGPRLSSFYLCLLYEWSTCLWFRVAVKLWAARSVTSWPAFCRYAPKLTTYKDFLATHFLDHNTHKKKREKELICDPRKWWPKSLSFPLSWPTSNQRLLAQSLAGGQDKGKGKGEAERCACEWPFTGFHLSGASRYFLFLIFLVQISSYYFFIIYEIGPGK